MKFEPWRRNGAAICRGLGEFMNILIIRAEESGAMWLIAAQSPSNHFPFKKASMTNTICLTKAPAEWPLEHRTRAAELSRVPRFGSDRRSNNTIGLPLTRLLRREYCQRGKWAIGNRQGSPRNVHRGLM